MSDKLIERIDKTINGMTLAAVKFADKPASPEFAGMLALLQDCKQRIEELESAKVELVDYIDEVLTLVEIYEGPSERGDALIAKHTPPEGENK